MGFDTFSGGLGSWGRRRAKGKGTGDLTAHSAPLQQLDTPHNALDPGLVAGRAYSINSSRDSRP
jgi:hypothetical protein